MCLYKYGHIYSKYINNIILLFYFRIYFLSFFLIKKIKVDIKYIARHMTLNRRHLTSFQTHTYSEMSLSLRKIFNEGEIMF